MAERLCQICYLIFDNEFELTNHQSIEHNIKFEPQSIDDDLDQSIPFIFNSNSIKSEPDQEDSPIDNSHSSDDIDSKSLIDNQYQQSPSELNSSCGISRIPKGRTIACKICSKLIMHRNIRRHERTHSAVKSHVCPFACGAVFANSDKLSDHVFKKHQEENTECSNPTANSNESFKIDSKSVNNESELSTLKHSPQSWKCTKCDRMFHTNYHLSQHNLKNPFCRPVTGTHKVKCKYCGKNISHKFMKVHVDSHFARRKHVCPFACGAAFVSRDSLRRHRRYVNCRSDAYRKRQSVFKLRRKSLDASRVTLIGEHIPETEVSKAISIIKTDHEVFPELISSKTIRKLRIYKQNGSDLRARHVKCRFCSKTFNCPSHMIKHERIHTGERPFPCEKGCGKWFNIQSNRTRHQIKCLGCVQ